MKGETNVKAGVQVGKFGWINFLWYGGRGEDPLVIVDTVWSGELMSLPHQRKLRIKTKQFLLFVN